jgi:hypothetical protein
MSDNANLLDVAVADKLRRLTANLVALSAATG